MAARNNKTLIIVVRKRGRRDERMEERLAAASRTCKPSKSYMTVSKVIEPQNLPVDGFFM